VDRFKLAFNYLNTHKKILLLALIILVIIGIIIIPKKKTTIATEKVKRGELVQSISANGTLESQNSVKLSFGVAGKLAYLRGKTGDKISKNSVLANLDQRSAQKNLQNALYDYSKQRNTFDQALKNNNVSNVNDAANENIKRILENNQYDLNKAVLSVELQDLAKEQSLLISPIDGIITREDVSTVGVNVNTTTVFEVTDPNSLEFQMEVDEADIGKIKEGQEVTMNLDPYPDDNIDLTVDYIDFSTHTTSTGGDAYYVKAKMNYDNSDYKYRVGMNGNAEIILGKKEDVLLIPLTSIFDDNKVYIKQGKKYIKKQVKLGVENDSYAEITSGIKEDDEIVLDPTQVK